jgi:hypothetical protein
MIAFRLINCVARASTTVDPERTRLTRDRAHCWPSARPYPHAGYDGMRPPRQPRLLALPRCKSRQGCTRSDILLAHVLPHDKKNPQNILFKFLRLLNDVFVFNSVCTRMFYVTRRTKLDLTYLCFKEFYFSSNLYIKYVSRFTRGVTSM